MSRITLTIHIDLPEGVTPDVDYSSGPNAAGVEYAAGMKGIQAQEVSQKLAAAVAPILHAEEPPPPWEQRGEKPTVGSMVWPEGQCPKHLRPWKDGKYGPFCSAKDDSTQKGFCELKPGMTWNSRKIPSVEAA